jgi:flagellar biosynthesis regulator FlaF
VGRSSISSLGCGSWREMVCAHLRLSLMSVGLWVKRNCIVELGVSDNYMHNIIAQTE